MLGTLHTVIRGDTLWDLSNKYFGDPKRWPEIFHHNNTPAVSLTTGSKIKDPDLIFVGQKIYIPQVSNGQFTNSNPVRRLPITSKTPAVLRSQTPPKIPSTSTIPTARPTPTTGPNTAKKRALDKIKSPAFKYELPSQPQTVISPAYVATIALKGFITLQSKNTMDFATITKTGFEITAKNETDSAFSKLLSNVKIGYNAKTNDLTFECGITTYSNNPAALKTTVKAGISAVTGLPVLKAQFTTPDIKGNVTNCIYVTSKLMIEIELTPKQNTYPTPRPIPVPNYAPKETPNWDYILGGALVVGAGVVIIGTLVEDILTLGGGIADDVPSFALAASMMATGTALLNSENTNQSKPKQEL